MTAAPPPQPVAYTYRSPWWAARFLFLVAAVCAFIAALCFASITHGPAWAWLAGAASAFALGWSVP